MTEFTEQPQEIKEVPQETQEVAEARQSLDRATLEPAAAIEKTVDIKTSEAVEAAVKEAVVTAVPAADGGRETGGGEAATPTATEDGGQRTEEAAEAAADSGQKTRAVAEQLSGAVDKVADLGSSIQESLNELQNQDQDLAGKADDLEESRPAENAGEAPPPPEGSREPIDPSDPIAGVGMISSAGSGDRTQEQPPTPGNLASYQEAEPDNSWEGVGEGEVSLDPFSDRVSGLDEETSNADPQEMERSFEGQRTPLEEQAEAMTTFNEGDEEPDLVQAAAPSLETQTEAAPALGTEDFGEASTSSTSKFAPGQNPMGSGIPVDDDLETGESKPSETNEPGTETAVSQFQKTSPASLAEGLSSLVSEGEGAQEKTSSGKSFDEVQTGELNRLSDAAMSAGSLATPYIPGGSVLVSALDGMTQLKEAAGNGGSGEGESSPPEDGYDDPDLQEDAAPQTRSISGIGETGDDQENTELYQLQIAALEKSIKTLMEQINDLQDQLKEEMKKIDQLQEMLKELYAEQPVEPSRKDFPSGEDGDAAYQAAFTDYRDQMDAFDLQVSQLQSQIAFAEETITAIQEAIEKRSEEIQQANDKINDLMGLIGSDSNQNIPSDPVDSPSGSIGINTDSGSATPSSSGTGLTDD